MRNNGGNILKSNVGHIQTWKESETPVIRTEGEKGLSMGPKSVIEREKRQKEKEEKRYKGEIGARKDAEQKSKLKSVDQGTACVWHSENTCCCFSA